MLQGQFDHYAIDREKTRLDLLVSNLSIAYGFDGWNRDYIHGIGMSALGDGYLIKVFDDLGVIWDAENHDMSRCVEMMSMITEQMEIKRPNSNGAVITQRFDITDGDRALGSVDISYYAPFFLSENDFIFLDKLALVFIYSSIVAAILSFIAGSLLAFRISKPIVLSAKKAREIALGNYDQQLAEKTHTRELSDLQNAINFLENRLSTAVLLRKRLTSDVAHELRTPLCAISSHLEAMIDGVWQPTNERLNSILDEAHRVTALIADLENLAEAESENIVLEKREIDLLSLAKNSAAAFAGELQKRNLTIEVLGVSTIVIADEQRIMQVIANLLSNAIKYAYKTVKISVITVDHFAKICVIDDGDGIDENDIDFVFERFYRADRSRSRKTGGVGIGLAIVKAIITAHGGVVRAFMRPTTFTITLPID